MTVNVEVQDYPSKKGSWEVRSGETDEELSAEVMNSNVTNENGPIRAEK